MQESTSGSNREAGNAKSGTLFSLLSGTDPEIWNELPAADRFPYLLTGFVNSVASAVIAMSSYLFFESILRSVYLAVFFAVLVFCLAGLSLRFMAALFIKDSLKPFYVVYLFLIPAVAFIVSQPVAMLISEAGLVQEQRASLISDTVQWTNDTASYNRAVLAYRDSIKLFEMSGTNARRKADSLGKVIISKSRDSVSLLKSTKSLEGKLQDDDKNSKSENQAPASRLTDAERKKLSEQLARQLQAFDLLKKDLSNVRISYQILSNPISELPYVKELYINKYEDSISALNMRTELLLQKIKDHRARIASLEGMTACQFCSFNQKFAYYRQHVFTSNSLQLVIVVIIVLMLILLYLPPYLIRRNRNDLYQQLLAAKDDSESISLRRKQIEEKFKIDTEMKAVKEVLQNFDGGGSESTQDITNNLTSTNDPKAFEALGDVQVKLQDYFRALEFYDRSISLNPELAAPWRKKAEVLSLLGRYAEEQQAKARYAELLEVERFRINLTRNTKLYNVELANLPFYGTFTWHLRSSMNIMLGKNGYGKSHLMSILLALMQEEGKLLRELTMMDKAAPTPVPYLKVFYQSDHERDSRQLEHLQQQLEEKSKMRAEYLARLRASGSEKRNDADLIQVVNATEWDSDIARLQREVELIHGMAYFDKLGIQSSYGKIPVLAIPDSRFINKSAESTSSRTDERSKKMLENGAYQFMMQVPYEDVIQNLLNTIATIFLDERNFDDEIFRLISRVFKRLTGHEFVWDTIQRTEDNSAFIIRVKTEGSETALPIQKASQGTLSVVAMMGMIYHYMSLRYPSVPRKQVLKQPAIIFIDEIDAHLHPSWQQKIIGILRKELPNVQFVISAHSPLVIAGCKEEEVCVLRKRSNGFTMEVIESNLIGKPIADIFRMIFEVEEKDEMYLQLAAQMPFRNAIKLKAQELREKAVRDEKEEAQLQELEQQIENFVYLEQFDSIRSSMDEMEDLKNANETLKMELEKLKAQMSRYNKEV